MSNSPLAVGNIYEMESITPNRVLIAADGSATSAKKAPAFDIVFVRNDGWCLGAPTRLERQAYDTWPEEWVSYVEHGVRKPIADFVTSREISIRH